MKKSIFAIALLALVGCAPSYKVKKEECPDLRKIKPEAGKAALVIGRTTRFGGGVNFEHYLDRDFIGSTKGYGFFVTPVDPGTHYVTAAGENHFTKLLQFEPNSTYYLQDEVRMGVWKARVALSNATGNQMYQEMDGDCSFFAKDPS